jgi:hypothetical protein
MVSGNVFSIAMLHVSRMGNSGGGAGRGFRAVGVERCLKDHLDRRPHDALAARHAAFFECESGTD